MERMRNKMEQIPFAVLVKEIADDPAYQPTIPLMRLIKEEYFSDFEECDENVTRKMSKRDQDIRLQGPNNPVTQPGNIYVKQEYVNDRESIEASDPGAEEDQLSGISSAEPYDVHSRTEQETMTDDLPTIKQEIESDFEDVPVTEGELEGSSVVVSDGHYFKHIFKVEEEMSTDSGSISKESVKYRDKSVTKGRNRPKCTICSKEFIKNSNLKVHLRIHTGEKPYECSVCKKAFNRADVLKEHSRLHNGEKSYECIVCKKAFIGKSYLKEHMQIHTGENPYECSVCKKAFNRVDVLKEHLRIHTGEKPYECSECKKVFNRADVLKEHLRIHTGEKPYECSVCEKAFIWKNNLTEHMRIHTGEKPYKCSICNKELARSGDLRVHLRIHTEEKPYECSVCKKAFTRSGGLKRHMQTHTGEKP